jgi:hypothetical protein
MTKPKVLQDVEATPLNGRYVFSYHLLDIDKTSFIAYLDLPIDTKVLHIGFDDNVKGFFAYTQNYVSDALPPLDKFRFSFLFVGSDWEVDEGVLENREYKNTIVLPDSIVMTGVFHVFVGYESLEEITLPLAMPEEKEVVAA